MLEKVISSSKDKKLSREEVEAITGAPKAGLVNDFIEALCQKKSDTALLTLSKVEESGLSVSLFATLVLEKSRFILLAEHSPSSKSVVKDRVSADDWEFIEKMVASKGMKVSILTGLLDAVQSIGRSKIEILPLEMMVVGVTGE
jgi:DNA polymerase III gamma/tau subunit